MDGASWFDGDEPIVGVVTDGADAEAPSETDVRNAIDAAAIDRPVSIETGSVESVLSAAPSLLVAIGESGVIDVARAAPDVPVLPLGSVSGLESIDAMDLPDALATLVAGDASVRQRPLLAVGDPDAGRTDRERALFDVTLVTEEPARISEFGVESRGDHVARFRADGVVVATPAGSHGYASAVDAPHISPAVEAVAVAPIAPFTTTTRRWILPESDLEIGVERDEGDVRLLADDRTVGIVSPGERVSITADGSLATIVLPESRL